MVLSHLPDFPICKMDPFSSWYAMHDQNDEAPPRFRGRG
jgi:hypothetical protein